MSTPIINPSWFYWLNVVNGIKTAAVISLIISLIGGVVAVFCYVDCFGYSEPDDKELKASRRLMVSFLVTVIVSVAVCIFVPSKNTLIEMQVAKFATYENAEWTVETIKSAVDYVVEAVKSLK